MATYLQRRNSTRSSTTALRQNVDTPSLRMKTYLKLLRHKFPHKNDFVWAQELQHDRKSHRQRGAAQETRHWRYLSNFIPEPSVRHC